MAGTWSKADIPRITGLTYVSMQPRNQTLTWACGGREGVRHVFSQMPQMFHVLRQHLTRVIMLVRKLLDG